MKSFLFILVISVIIVMGWHAIFPEKPKSPVSMSSESLMSAGVDYYNYLEGNSSSNPMMP